MAEADRVTRSEIIRRLVMQGVRRRLTEYLERHDVPTETEEKP